MKVPESAGVDPDLLATAAARISAAILPAPPAIPPWTWRGSGELGAARVLGDVLALHRWVATALRDVGDALARSAVALHRAADLDRAALRVVAAGGDPALAERLRADAEAERAVTDAALAARLRGLVNPAAPIGLRPLVVGADPASPWVGRPLAEVPADVVAEVAALEPAVVAGDPTAPVALRLETAGMVADPAVLGPGRTFLFAADGEVAEVWGDVTSARDVVVMVPGTGTSVDRFDEARAHGEALADALGAGSVGSAAVVVWLGSPLPASLLSAALQRWAKAAAPRLTAFVDGLALRPDQRLTLVGHSYGGVVAGLAVHEGLRPAALVGVAPAGFGPTVRSTDDLGGVPTYVLQDARDPIRDVHVIETAAADLAGPIADRLTGALGIGHLGDDPVCLPGAVRLASPHDASPLLPIGFDASIHAEYFTPGSEGLAQLVAVARGEPVVEAGCR